MKEKHNEQNALIITEENMKKILNDESIKKGVKFEKKMNGFKIRKENSTKEQYT